MRQWLNQLVQTSQQYDQQQNDPRSGEYAKQQQELAQQRAQLLGERIRNAVQPEVERAVEASLKEWDRNGIFKGQARIDMLNAIVNEIDRTLGLESGYQTTLAALKQKGDIAEIAKFITRNVDMVRGPAARTVWRSRAEPFQGQPRQAPAPTQAPRQAGRTAGPGAILPIPAKPNHNDIDWDRDPTRDLFISGKAYLKNGKLVSWRNNGKS
jgi:hypothetical protein